MENLSFDDGFKSFAINGDESRVIRFHPADPNFIQRYYKAMEDINSAKNQIGEDIKLNQEGELKDAEDMESAALLLAEVDRTIRDGINYMLNADAYDIAFGTQSPFCIVGGGKFLFEAFTDAIKAVIGKHTKEASKASQKRMNKYLREYRK